MNDASLAESAAVPASNRSEYVVRCGSMRALGVMSSMVPYQYGDEVVVRSTRGTEIGTVLCEATPTTTELMEEPTEGRILRRVSEEDRRQWERLSEKTNEDLKVCARCVDKLGLKMQLVDIERILGGEKIVVFYLADARVDFRQLVRDLAKEFQTRIEMRHIGVRDEAKLLADYGDCGQPICCATFLSKMPPVSMKMAKVQKSTLDPTKISGRCGRLKCCLRYEYSTYESLRKELPPVGASIVTEQGKGRVLAQEILASQVLVEMEDHRRVLIAGNEVLTVLKKGSEARK